MLTVVIANDIGPCSDCPPQNPDTFMRFHAIATTQSADSREDTEDGADKENVFDLPLVFFVEGENDGATSSTSKITDQSKSTTEFRRV